MRTAARSLSAGLVVAVTAILTTFVSATPAEAAVLVSSTPVSAWRANGTTNAVVVVGGVTYIGGTFTQVVAPDGTTRSRANLAAFDTHTGALIETFRADTNGPVRALVSDGTTLWVGGSYTSIGGVSRSRLAAVQATTGAVRTTFSANADSNIYGLDLRAGRLFVGGSFSTLSNASRSRVGAVNPATGAIDTSWNPGADAAVRAVRSNPTGSVVYLAGNFSHVGGAARLGVAAVTGVTGTAANPVFRDSYSPSLGLDMNESGTRLYVAAGGSGNQVAAYDTSTGVKLWRQRADGDVQAVAYFRDTVYFGFHEGFAGDTTVRLLAAQASDGALDSSFRPTFDRFWGTFALSVSDDALAAGGDFTRVSNVPAQGLVLFPAGPPPPPPPPTVDYLSQSTTWRFLDTGTAPAGAWTATGYDASSWRSGTPQFGFGDGDETTLVSYGPDPNHKYISTYFRTTFDAATRPTRATLSLVADDGAVVYLNGVEVLRDNMPAGTISPTTFAATNRSGTAENQVRTFTIDPALITVGTNTIAVEVHQDAQSSSDLSFDLGLKGELPA